MPGNTRSAEFVNAGEPPVSTVIGPHSSRSLISLPPAYRGMDGWLRLYDLTKSKESVVQSEELLILIAQRYMQRLGDDAHLSDAEKVSISDLARAFFMGEETQVLELIQGLSKAALSYRGWRGLNLAHLLLLLVENKSCQIRLLQEVFSRFDEFDIDDVPDFLGATARLRARQLGRCFNDPGDAVEGVVPGCADSVPGAGFHDFDLMKPDGSILPIRSAHQGVKAMREFWGRDDVMAASGLCEKDFLLYLYLYLPEAFSLQFYNNFWQGLIESQRGVTVNWEAKLPELLVTEHAELGEGQMGLYAKEHVQAGTIVRSLQGYTRFQVMRSFSEGGQISNYCYFAFPADEVMKDVDGLLMGPLVGIMPEESMSPIMYMNDGGAWDSVNTTWMPLIVDGLPSATFVALKDIPKGGEFLCDYMTRSRTWNLLRHDILPIKL